MGYLILALVAYVLFKLVYKEKDKPAPTYKESLERDNETISTVHFSYEDAVGNITERTVDVLSGRKGEKFRAFCHLRNEVRSFFFSRIINFEVIDVDSGEVMTPMEWRYKLQGTKVAKQELAKEKKRMAQGNA